MSATMGFAGMAALTHEMEDVFELLRQRKGGLERAAVTVLLRCLDVLSEAVDAIDGGGERIVPGPLIAELRGLVRNRRVVRIDVQLADDVQMPAVRRGARVRRREALLP
jgi:two-component system chemotaxis sensor kinase CheA